MLLCLWKNDTSHVKWSTAPWSAHRWSGILFSHSFLTLGSFRWICRTAGAAHIQEWLKVWWPFLCFSLILFSFSGVSVLIYISTSPRLNWKSFHSDVCHNTEVKTCCNFHFITTINLTKNKIFLRDCCLRTYVMWTKRYIDYRQFFKKNFVFLWIESLNNNRLHIEKLQSKHFPSWSFIWR